MADMVNATTGAEVTGAENVTENVNGSGQQTGTAEQGETSAQKTENKTFTEAELSAEVDRRVQQAQKKWQAELETRLKSERDEGARLAKLSADERAKEEQEKAQKEFEKERAQYNREKLEFETTKQLAELKLPVSFASLLAGADAEETKANIDKFQKEWNSAIQSEIDNKLKGTAPKSGAVSETDAFLSGFNKK